MNLDERFEKLDYAKKVKVFEEVFEYTDKHDLDLLFQSLYNIALANDNDERKIGILKSDLDWIL